MSFETDKTLVTPVQPNAPSPKEAASSMSEDKMSVTHPPRSPLTRAEFDRFQKEVLSDPRSRGLVGVEGEGNQEYVTRGSVLIFARNWMQETIRQRMRDVLYRALARTVLHSTDAANEYMTLAMVDSHSKKPSEKTILKLGARLQIK